MFEQIIRPDQSGLEWRGAIDVEHTERWSRAWRLPFRDIDLFPGDDLRGRAVMGAGVRLCFRSDSTTVGGTVVDGDAQAERAPVDLVIDGERVATANVIDGRFEFNSLPARLKDVEIWLPQFGDFRLEHVGLESSASVEAPSPTRSPRIVTYGSSITQCRTAASPTRTWPALLARDLGLDLTCLGYGGQAHLDPMVARMIRDLPADVILTCLGINVHGSGTFTARSFLPAVLGFLTTIRDGHPNVPILVISPIVSPDREDQPSGGGLTLRHIRGDVETAVHVLREHGDADISLLSGLDVIGLDEAAVLGDGLHPDSRGYELMASKITPAVAQLIR